MKNSVTKTVIMLGKYSLFGILLQVFFFTTLLAGKTNAQKHQSVYEVSISINVDDASLEEVFQEIESKTNFNFFFNKAVFDKNIRITLRRKNSRVADILMEVSRVYQLQFKQINSTINVNRKPADTTGDPFKIDVTIQTRTISGKVTSYEDNEGLPGVNVIEKGTNNGTVTNVQGEYSLKVSDGAVIVFSSVGYTTEEVEVGNRTTIDLAMTQDIQQLQELVVVGYGATKKEDLTGSVATVSSKEMTIIPNINFEQGLQGRAAGVQVTQTSAEPGGAISIRVRGTGSLNASSEPLYVIDGFPIANNANTNSGGTPINPLANLNPNDIESVQVLKDASATAIYGSRGANGVVIITTKRGQKGSNRIEFQQFTSFSSSTSKPIELANSQEYAQYDNDWNANFNQNQRYVGENTPETFTETTDWFDQILRGGLTQNYQVNFTGGNDNVQYYVSGNYIDDEGIVVGSAFNRLGLRANLNSQIGEKLKVDVNLTHNRSLAERVTSNFGALNRAVGSVVIQGFKANPITGLNDPIDDSNILTLVAPNTNPGGSQYLTLNPLRDIAFSDIQTLTNYTLLNANMGYEIFDFLSVNVNAGLNINNTEASRFESIETANGFNVGGRGNLNTGRTEDFLLENYLTFKKNYGKHNFNAVGGWSVQQIDNASIGLSASNFSIQTNGVDDFTAADPATWNIGRGRSQRRLVSYYGRLSYTFNDKYLFTFTARQDGASVFTEANKFAFFPSGAFAWRVSDENFMSGLEFLSDLKLRASYGLSGNQAIGAYQSLDRAQIGIGSTLPTQINGRYAFQDGLATSGVVVNNPANNSLVWEKTSQLNVGFDAGFFDNRLRVTFDYYDKTTEDLLQARTLASQTGFTTIIDNIGTINNKGFEITLGADVVNNANFRYSTDFNFSANRTNVVELGDADTVAFRVGYANLGNTTSHVLIEGQEIGLIWGYNVTGLLSQQDIEDGYPLFAFNQQATGAGTYKVEDVDGNGSIGGNDRQVIGNPNPDFLLGWNNSFTFNNFDLSVFFQGQIGGDILNFNRLLYESGINTADGGRPSKDYLNNRWTPSNTDAEYPTFQSLDWQDFITSRLVEDGSFVRLKNITLGYTLPAGSISWLSALRLYVSGTNVLTFTNYSGFDPEVSAAGDTNIFGGVDIGSYPRARIFTAGLNVTF